MGGSISYCKQIVKYPILIERVNKFELNLNGIYHLVFREFHVLSVNVDTLKRNVNSHRIPISNNLY